MFRSRVPETVVPGEIASYATDISGGLGLGHRAFGHLKPTMPKFSGDETAFPSWKIRFEAFVSHVGCVSAFFTDQAIDGGESCMSVDSQLVERATVLNQ